MLKIRRVLKEEVATLIPYHYLVDQSKGFRSGFNYGVGSDNELQAVCIFHNPSVPEVVQGCFGLDRAEQNGIFELGRLIKNPSTNKDFILSKFVATAMKQLRQDTEVKAILSYAGSRYHSGYIYQALNFKYYGLTTQKSDFWFECEDGNYIKHTRGPVKDAKGEWRLRPRKHRYLLVYDKELKVRWVEQKYPKGDNTNYKTNRNNYGDTAWS